jgi:eukaryotic-like serine/threonine-protein kinase
MESLINQILSNRYRIESSLGRGGMAEVFKAWDQERATYLALKVLRQDLAQDTIFLRRFKREAQILKKLEHPHIVRFYGVEVDRQYVFMLMDYVQGTSLQTEIFMKNGTSMEKAMVSKVMQAICSALHYAHRKNLVHCDIKPGNIMINHTGDVLLADFGIARMTDAATSTMVGFGTPAYMAPELVLGIDPTPQSDIYSMGVVLYEMVTGGERPFTGESANTTGMMTSEKVRWEQMNLKPPLPRQFNPAVSPELEMVVMRCLEKTPGKRFASALDLLNAVEVALGGESKTVKKPDVTGQPEPNPVSIDPQQPSQPAPHMGSVPVQNNSMPVPQTADMPMQNNQQPVPQAGGVPVQQNNSQPASHANGSTGQEKNKKLPLWLWLGFVGVILIVIMVVIGSKVFAIWSGRGDATTGGGNSFAASNLPAQMTQFTETLPPTEIPTATIEYTPTIAATATVTSTPTLEPGTVMINPIDEAEMVYVPAGEFVMGSEDQEANGNEGPRHKIYLDAYWIYKYEVTNEQYRLCCEEGGCSSYAGDYPENDKPAKFVDWFEADAYCQWVGGSLPTEAQWEKAARGTDARTYPWGNESPNCYLAQMNNCGGATSVGSLPDGASPYGAMDMAGNLLEWVADWYKWGYYSDSPYENPTGPGGGDARVLRGGSWMSTAVELRVTNRDKRDPSTQNTWYGFRCVGPDLIP